MQHRSQIRTTVILCQLLWTLADRLAKFSERQETLFLARQKTPTDCFIALCRIIKIEKRSRKQQTLTMQGTLFLDPLKTATYYYDRKDSPESREIKFEGADSINHQIEINFEKGA